MNSNFFRPIFCAFALAIATACTSISAVAPGPFVFDKAIGVEVGKTWTSYPRTSRTKSQRLTIDGLPLGEMLFSAKLKSGQALIYTTDREKILPVFRDDMLPGELAEFVLDSLSYSGMQQTKLTELRPDRFGVDEAVRFTFSGASANGLNYSGVSKVAVINDTLYLILFYAPSEYYYGLHEQEVQQILDSAKVL